LRHNRHPVHAIIFAAAVSATQVSPAFAETSRQFNVAAGPLSSSLIRFAEQADISIAINDPALSRIQSRGLRGRYTTRSGLNRLLSGTGYDFAIVSATTVRLLKRAAKPPKKNKSALKRPVPPPEPSVPDATLRPDPPIIVTATKQMGALADYPASMAVVELDPADTSRFGSQGSDYLLQRLPNLAGTNLGPGRNKIFIRGIADSSFNGLSQATISQYYGEARLIYSAPDPNLANYDMARIEVLEGPQGTLYGAGTLGGIIRAIPVAPDLVDIEGRISVGVQTVNHGETGGDFAAIANVPIITDRLAIRALVYQSKAPGYIDDAQRNLRDVNNGEVTGFRITLRLRTDDGWEFDAGILGQNIDSADGQYAELDQPQFVRRSAVAQPFDNDYQLAHLTATKSWGETKLVTTTGYANHQIDSIFDATNLSALLTPTAFAEEMKVSLLSHETRLTGKFVNGGYWVAGMSAVDNKTSVVRRFGPPGSELGIGGEKNSTLDLAVFGEATVTPLPDISFTGGGRFSYVQQMNQQTGAGSFAAPRRRSLRFLPTAAIAWKPSAALLLFARYQQGFRPGGLKATGTGSTALVTQFSADEIRTIEAGMRFGTSPNARFSGGLSASIAHWNDIQADLIDAQGFPFTANIGSGQVRSVEINIKWRPLDAFSLEATGFLANSSPTDPALFPVTEQDSDLPNIADKGWRLAARFDRSLSDRTALRMDAALRYVGDSNLAIDGPLQLKQGDYYEASAGARLGFGSWGVSLDVENLFDSYGNRFSFGNPFTAVNGLQVTPLRPRSIRLGVDVQF
jgi:iron complex outermembrane recepter protein